jgi:hypothetical protein
MSWRDQMPIHPAALLFPRLSDDELTTLGKDIRKRGLIIPPMIFCARGGDESLLDGVSRFDGMERVGIKFELKRNGADWEICSDLLLGGFNYVYETDGVDPYQHVVSVNLHRRHLTADQKRDLIAKLLKLDPGKTNRQIAKEIDASPTTVGKVRANVQAGHNTDRIEASGRRARGRRLGSKSESDLNKPDDDVERRTTKRKVDPAANEAPAQRIEREQLDNVLANADFASPPSTPSPTLDQLAERIRVGQQKAEHGLAGKVLATVECLLALVEEVSAQRVFDALPEGPAPKPEEVERLAAWCIELARLYRGESVS